MNNINEKYPFPFASKEEIALYLGTTLPKLNYIIYGLPSTQKYHPFAFPKKNGKTRTIQAPCYSLKKNQQKLNCLLQDYFYQNYHAKREKYVFGFLKGQTICGNAEKHINQKYVVNIDLKDFFNQITFPRVRGLFLKYPFNLPDEVATFLAHIATFNGTLPQGAPTSPIISNFICARMDGELWRYAKKNNLIYTRYADDITLSSNASQIPHTLGYYSSRTFHLSNHLKKIITEKNFFEINEEKIRCMRRNSRQEVTGLTVNDKVNVAHHFVKQIRAMLHDWEINGEERALQNHFKTRKRKSKNPPKNFSNIVFGKIMFVKQICGEESYLFRKFLFDYRRISKVGCPLIPGGRREWLSLGIYIIEGRNIVENEDNQGTGFYIPDFGLITCNHVIEDIMTDTIRVYIHKKSVEKHKVQIKYFDKAQDFAVLEIIHEESDDAPLFGFYYSKEICPSQRIFIAGYPNHDSSDNNDLTLTEDKVIGERTSFKYPLWNIQGAILTGNSGGPVFNERFEVIGIAARGAENQDASYNGWNSFVPISSVIDYAREQKSNSCNSNSTRI